MDSARTYAVVNNNDLRKMRGCSNPEMRKLVLDVMRAGFRYRMTRSGVLFYGENGETASVHFTHSDHRATKNAVTQFRKIGYEPTKK